MHDSLNTACLIKQYTRLFIITLTNLNRFTKLFHCHIFKGILYTTVLRIHLALNVFLHYLAGLELPPEMPGISPALVAVVPGTALAKNIPAGDTIIPG